MATNRTQRTLRTGLLGLLLALMMVSFLALTASAQVTVQRGGITASPAAGLTVDIKIIKGLANFTPNSVSCKPTQPLTIANDTSVTQTVTFMGNPAAKIPAHKSVTKNCGGTPGTSFTLGLKSNPKAKLTVHVK